VSSPVLEFAGVHKHYPTPAGGVLRVLENLSFAVYPDRVTALVGPSGCGKTTLLQLIAGLIRPTQGQVRFRGQPITGVNQQIGYVTQQANLFPWYTLRQNVEFPLVVRGVPPAERAAKVAQYLEQVGLAGFEDHYPHQLSGGMQKRAAIVRTLIYSPDVVLMDEPFASLDAQTRMLMHDDLLRLWQQHRKTIFFVTHDLVEALVLADNILLLSKRPTRIKEDFAVPIPRPRNVFEPYGMPGFVETYERVWELFKSEVVPDGVRAE
jgi:NitT/TauT family transport system ATP-binding protein